MNPKFYLIACLSFSFNQMATHQAIAMGNKNVPVESATLKTKQQLIEELFTLFYFDKITLEAFLQPFEKEFKELGLPEKPFAQSIQKLSALTNELSTPLRDLIKDLYMRAHENTFTQQELADLVDLYKKPVIQKMNISIINMITEPIIKALKDPQIFAEYSSKFMAIGMTIAAQNHPQKTKELLSIAIKEFKEFKQNKEIYTPEFLEKLKQRYAGLAPTLEQYFGKEISIQKINDIINNIGKTTPTTSTEKTNGIISQEHKNSSIETPTLPN